MKVKINIDIFDNSSLQQCESLGFGTKALETLYRASFTSILEEICEDGADYTLAVEVEDNTTT